MNAFQRLIAASGILSLTLLAGCAGGHVKPDERDTTGAYDGVWIGEVAGPRASRVELPGQWYTTCDWEPYEFYLTVDDGRVRIGRLDEKAFVSTDGDFRIDIESDRNGGGQFVQKVTGTLREDELVGRYLQFNTARGTTGCSAPVRYRRYTDSAA